jgi:hypothetical protein
METSERQDIVRSWQWAGFTIKTQTWQGHVQMGRFYTIWSVRNGDGLLAEGCEGAWSEEASFDSAKAKANDLTMNAYRLIRKAVESATSEDLSGYRQ